MGILTVVCVELFVSVCWGYWDRLGGGGGMLTAVCVELFVSVCWGYWEGGGGGEFDGCLRCFLWIPLRGKAWDSTTAAPSVASASSHVSWGVGVGVAVNRHKIKH